MRQLWDLSGAVASPVGTLHPCKPQEESDILKIVRMVAARHYDPCIVFNFSKKECEALAHQASPGCSFNSRLQFNCSLVAGRLKGFLGMKGQCEALAHQASPGCSLLQLGCSLQAG